jgi:hypothetical protein
VISLTSTRASRLQRSGLVSRVALAAAVLAQAGCFYFGAINERPRARIEKLSDGPYFYPADVLEFDAVKSSDSDSSGLLCRWRSYVCAAANDCDPIDSGTDDVAPDFVYQVRLPDGRHDPVQVQLTCHDTDGADSRDQLEVEVGNRPPVVSLQIHQGAQAPGLTAAYVVTIPIELDLVVADPDPGDTATVTWSYAAPVGSSPGAVVFEPTDDSGLVYQLVPDVEGVWQVDVTADDGVDAEGHAELDQPIVVDADQPPCVAITSPAADPTGRLILRRADGPRAFSVLHVSDDLDPYPSPLIDSPYLGAATFAWQLAGPQTGGQLAPLAGAGAAQVTIDPNDYAPGDQIDLRVEVADRVDRTLPCDPGDPTCSIAGDTCLERVTWGVEIR